MRYARVAMLGLLAAVAAYGLTHRDLLAVDRLLAHLEALGAWGPPVFVVAYAIAALLFLPGSALTLASGALFGPLLGTACSLLGATLGATLAFLAARTLAGDLVRRRAGGRLEPILRGVDDEGWRFVAFTRLVPLFPFNLLNYALGLTRIRLLPYVVTSAICMLPATAAFTWLGHAGRQAIGGDRAAIQAGLVGLALLATAIFVLPRLVARWRKS